MRIPTRTSRRTLGLNMTPMIDVVFLLIIFFLVSSHLARREQQLPLPLPHASTGQRPDERPAHVTVHVLADGSLHVAGRTVDPAGLTALLVQRRQVHGAGLAVRVRADRQVPFRQVEPVLVACSHAGIWHVSYAVEPRPQRP